MITVQVESWYSGKIAMCRYQHGFVCFIFVVVIIVFIRFANYALCLSSGLPLVSI